MKYTIYEHPVRHQFALINVPAQFAEGDALPMPSSGQWFATRAEGEAMLPLLFIQEQRLRWFTCQNESGESMWRVL